MRVGVAVAAVLGRDDQGDNDLHTIFAFVTAIAVAALVVSVLRRGRLEIGAGEIIEQHIEPRAEQILPALAQVTVSNQMQLLADEMIE